MSETTKRPAERKLKPCPFCGQSARVSLHISGIDDKYKSVMCGDCGGSTDWHRTIREAERAWNLRWHQIN